LLPAGSLKASLAAQLSDDESPNDRLKTIAGPIILAIIMDWEEENEMRVGEIFGLCKEDYEKSKAEIYSWIVRMLEKEKAEGSFF